MRLKQLQLPFRDSAPRTALDLFAEWLMKEEAKDDIHYAWLQERAQSPVVSYPKITEYKIRVGCDSKKPNIADGVLSFLGSLIKTASRMRMKEKVHHPKVHHPHESNPYVSRTMKRGGYVYLVQLGDQNMYKIGLTIDPQKRIKAIGTKLPWGLNLIVLIKAEDRFFLETQLHNKFHHKRVSGEWFALDPEDVEYIKELAHE